MKFTLPALPFSPDALRPVISKETIQYHWGKHEQNYIDTLNKLIEGTEYADMPLEEIVAKSEGKIFNNASQAWNHIFYFFQFGHNEEKVPSGSLAKQIETQFGSFEEFKKQFAEAGATLFGSGWVWLAADAENKLFIIQGPNAYNPIKMGLRPIMTIDVWEHAYYIDYKNKRADYLSKIWDIIDWDIIRIRYEK